MLRGRALAASFLCMALAGIAGTPGLGQDQAGPAAEGESAPPKDETGTLVVQFAGNRTFCVDRNEVDIKPGTVKPRQYRNAPLVTTFGYKYQISANRRGTTAIVKLMESPVIRTAYMIKEPFKKEPPQPRLATPKDSKVSSQPLQPPKKVPRWIPESTCTTLLPEYSFPLAPGQYDVYVGFDLLLNNGQWVPLQSDFVTDVTLEKDQETRVDGRVDYTDGVRTVKLDSFEKPAPPARK